MFFGGAFLGANISQQRAAPPSVIYSASAGISTCVAWPETRCAPNAQPISSPLTLSSGQVPLTSEIEKQPKTLFGWTQTEIIAMKE